MSYRQPKKIDGDYPEQDRVSSEENRRSASGRLQHGSWEDSYFEEEFYEDRYETFPNNEEDVEDYVTYDDFYDDIRYYQKSSKEPSGGRRFVGKLFCVLQGVISLLVIFLLLRLNVLPDTTMIIVAAVLVIVWLLVFFSQRKVMQRIQAGGLIFSIVFCALMTIGSLYLLRTDSMLQQVTGRSYDISTFDVVVRADDPAQTLEDVKDYTFAVQSSYGSDHLGAVVRSIEQEIDSELTLVDSAGSLSQVEALYNGDVDGMIYNEVFASTILEQYPDFEGKTRVLKAFQIKTESADIKGIDVDVNAGAFLVFISGTDSEGEVSLTGRSDVDIVAGINTVSQQILLITIPRDFYVEFPGITAYGTRDKLTHAGIYGMDVLMSAVENLLGYDLNYYVRLNFSSMREIVNAMGGVTIYNEQEFISNELEYHYPEGWIYDMDGELTLAYVRERYAFEDGDFARGRHQLQVIQAMLDKLVSINTLTNYDALASAISTFAVTNIPTEDITEIIKIQLRDNPQWHVVNYQLLGDVMFQPCQSANGAYLSVDMPYQESVDNARTLLKELFDGEVLSEDLQLSMDDDTLTYVTAPVN